MTRLWQICLKTCVSIVAVGSPWVIGRIAWIQLFQDDETRIDYARVLLAGPQYLVQSFFFIELVCLLILLGFRWERKTKVIAWSAVASGLLLFVLFFIWPTMTAALSI